MSQSSGSSGRGDVTWPDSEYSPGVKGRDLDIWAGGSWAGSGPPDCAPGFPPPGGLDVAGWPLPPAAGRPRRARVSWVGLAAVAMLSLVLGAGIALAFTHGPGGNQAGAADSGGLPPAGTAPSAVPSTAPSALAPSSAPSIVVPSHGSSGLSPGGALPGGAGALPGSSGGHASGLLFLGTVSALSGHSVTLTAQGQTVTARLTSATKITGRLKVGDMVSAQLTKAAGGSYVVSAIQDPPGLP